MIVLVVEVLAFEPGDHGRVAALPCHVVTLSEAPIDELITLLQSPESVHLFEGRVVQTRTLALPRSRLKSVDPINLLVERGQYSLDLSTFFVGILWFVCDRSKQGGKSLALVCQAGAIRVAVFGCCGVRAGV